MRWSPGWQAPAVRSAAGFTALFMIARFFYREGRVMNLLAAIAIGFLAPDPEQLFDASFQLSFGAVAFIAAFAVPLVERTSGLLRKGLVGLPGSATAIRVWNPAPPSFPCGDAAAGRNTCALDAPAGAILPGRRGGSGPHPDLFYELALTSAMIQIGLALPMAVYFHRVSFSGLSANVVIVPLLGLAIPVGFIAVFTGWGVSAQIAAWLLALSPDRRRVARPPGTQLACPQPSGLAGYRDRRSVDCGRAAGAIIRSPRIPRPASGLGSRSRRSAGTDDLASRFSLR